MSHNRPSANRARVGAGARRSEAASGIPPSCGARRDSATRFCFPDSAAGLNASFTQSWDDDCGRPEAVMCWVAEPDSLYLDALRWLDDGRVEEAIAGFARVRAARPNHSGACLNLARALLGGGRAAEALEVLEARAWDMASSE